MSNEALNAILTTIVVPIIVAIVPFICVYLNKKREEVAASIKDKALVKYLDIAEDAIETAVVSVSQTFVDAIKSTEEWTPEAKGKAFLMAKDKAIYIMGTAARLAIKEAYGDFDSWLNNSIEYYVNKNKVTCLTETVKSPS